MLDDFGTCDTRLNNERKREKRAREREGRRGRRIKRQPWKESKIRERQPCKESKITEERSIIETNEMMNGWQWVWMVSSGNWWVDKIKRAA